MTHELSKDDIAAINDLKPGYTLGHADVAILKALLAAHEQKPVGWIYEDELPENYPYDAMFPYSKVDVVRMFPVFGPTAPSIPAAVPEKMTYKEACNFVQINHMATEDRATLAMRTFNHCRAAMLQSEPVSQPYKLPDGYVLMPVKLTAENGAKYALSGEFHVLHRVTCHECGGEGCSDCDDDGWLEEKIMIGWDDIKDIYRAAVEACSIKSTVEGV